MSREEIQISNRMNRKWIKFLAREIPRSVSGTNAG